MTPASTLTLRSGHAMPVIGLGTWQLTRDTAGTVLRALELGYRMIDTSGDYGTQPGIGKAIRDSGLDRSALYVVTKVEETDRAYEATCRNLEALGLDHADLMLIHRPPASGAGEALWEGLLQARGEGLARDIGVSNYTVEQMQALAAASGEMPAVNQIEWTPFGHSDRMRAFCREQRILVQAYSPLTRAQRLDDARLQEVAQRHGGTPAQVLVRWNLQLGTVPLPKANHAPHLEENLGAFDIQLDERDMDALAGLNARWSSLGALAYA